VRLMTIIAERAGFEYRTGKPDDDDAGSDGGGDDW
jgi:hypothetical protein